MQKRLLVLPVMAVLSLTACFGYSNPYPSSKNIGVNGAYLGRLADGSGDSALLDITLSEKNLALSATVRSRANGQTYQLTGTRGVYGASPVQLDLFGGFGAGSACSGGFTETYGVTASLSYPPGSSASKSVQGGGSVRHQLCQGGQFAQVLQGSGRLELSKQ